MFTIFAQQLKPAFLMLFWMMLLTGLAYPLAMTGAGKALFPAQASGSLILGQSGPAVPAGSALIGQPFESPRHFWGRPSATSPHAYNAGASSGSNLGPSNPALAEAVAERVAKLKGAHGDAPIPMDLVTASGSGLDPHISPQAAAYQVDRVSTARKLSRDSVSALVVRHTQGPLWGFWGEPRVNVLELNLALDALADKE
ncbi:Potassium-transporting ATPase KdpC subunit [Fundidesulfovibrio magnetotacticus]|uniref:Potassium-transporting ATPase KdpC subunit n=1 Tax=Fundidesulfovibrio magnetotacticus TaxID=2730080 RepID=A0A6V8LWV3_9BACT|nr:potassium-transporting ATPase subunit KdpC [Fundidesulfovibrio magnetotacticus]GFK94748.1 Potassium-transporting ATPase KdpC subunit [Fundidesulfovibrio magnetotacticus]